jgi:hypothetical protein
VGGLGFYPTECVVPQSYERASFATVDRRRADAEYAPDGCAAQPKLSTSRLKVISADPVQNGVYGIANRRHGIPSHLELQIA